LLLENVLELVPEFLSEERTTSSGSMAFSLLGMIYSAIWLNISI